MTELTEKKLKEKQDILLALYEGLKSFQVLPREQLDEKFEYLWAIMYGLIAAIDVAMDISQLALASRGKKAESYGSLPDKLYALKIIDEDFRDRFRELISLRNRAIHSYPALDSWEVYNVLHQNLDDFRKFLSL